ncbi:hypothetical protein HDU76_005674 [Blyttiomyces sp. JEL0837]|nr:hypothetical protein HDU76_005674 [Blyttiomyces sp. JEL0837]
MLRREESDSEDDFDLSSPVKTSQDPHWKRANKTVEDAVVSQISKAKSHYPTSPLHEANKAMTALTLPPSSTHIEPTLKSESTSKSDINIATSERPKEDLEEGEIIESDCIIQIHRLAPKTTEALLKRAMSAYGEVVSVGLIHRPKQQVVGMVEFSSAHEANSVVKTFQSIKSHPHLGMVILSKWQLGIPKPEPTQEPISKTSEPEPKTEVHASTQTCEDDWKPESNNVTSTEDKEVTTPVVQTLQTQAPSALVLATVQSFLYIPDIPLSVSSKSLLSLFAPYTHSGATCFARSVNRMEEDTNNYGIVGFSREVDALAAMAAIYKTDPFLSGTDLDMEDPKWRKALHVSKVPVDVRLSSLMSVFDQFGTLKAARLVQLDGEERSTDCEARVEYENEEVAVRAVVGLLDKEVDLRVNKGTVSVVLKMELI